MKEYNGGKRSSRHTDLTGLKFGKLTALTFMSKQIGDRTQYFWECECECGSKTLTRGSELKSGNTEMCLPCARKVTAAKNLLPDHESIINRVYKSYKTGAKTRGLEFGVDMALFKKLISGDCAYCGDAPRVVAGEIRYMRNGEGFKRNGLDRVDSAVGYLESNVVPCCTSCNVAKLDRTNAEFIAWVKRLYVNIVKLEKPSTTIPQGSTAQANGAGNANSPSGVLI